MTVLQRMGLLMGLDTGTSSEEDIHKLKQLVPVEFQSLIESEWIGWRERVKGWVDNIGEFAFVYSGTLWHRN